MDLRQVVHDHVIAEEPVLPMAVGDVLARGRRTVRVRRLVAAGACALLVGGGALVLGSQTGDRSGPDPADGVQLHLDSPIFTTISGGLSHADYELAAHQEATNRMNACLAELGYSQRQPDADPARFADAEVGALFNTLHLHDDAFRAAHGYGLVDGVSGLPEEPTAWQEGVPAAVVEQCRETPRAEQSLRDTVGIWMENILTVQGQVEEDPRIVAAELAWVDCMAERGHHYDGPLTHAGPSGFNDVSARLQRALDQEAGPAELAEIHAYEVTVAEADWTCRVAHFNDVYIAVRAELEQAYVDAHPAEAAEARAAAAELASRR